MQNTQKRIGCLKIPTRSQPATELILNQTEETDDRDTRQPTNLQREKLHRIKKMHKHQKPHKIQLSHLRYIETFKPMDTILRKAKKI